MHPTRPLRRFKLALTGFAVAVAVTLGVAAPALAAPTADRPTVVILGYGLKDDGTMRPELVDRLNIGLAAAVAIPQSTIIVTGGNPHNGKTEAGEMKKYLTGLGFPKDRVLAETKAVDTITNAENSIPIADDIDSAGLIIVTSSSHQKRASKIFRDRGATVLATISFPDRSKASGSIDPADLTQFVTDLLSPVSGIVSLGGE